MSQPNLARDLLGEALAAAGPKQRARAREHGMFDAIAGASRRMVVFGSGYLGKVARTLARNADFEVVAFADNDPARWGTVIDGVAVVSPSEAVLKHNADAAFIVGVFNSAAPRRQLRELGCKRIVPFPLFFWRFPACFPGDPWFDLPHAILEQTDPMRLGYECLSDERSRQEFASQIQWRCTLDYSCLPPASPGADTYYEPDLVHLKPDEVLADCGAFDGDSIRMFLERSNRSFRHIYAIEPDPRNRAALESSVIPLLPDGSASLSILPYGLGSRNETVSFAVTGTAGSHVTTADGHDVISIECRRLDDILNGPPPTFIKMDIEGAEPGALLGAQATIRSARPILAVCAYHRCDHLWKLPVLMKNALPEYHIFLRRYAEECWELVYYAVPPERLTRC